MANNKDSGQSWAPKQMFSSAAAGVILTLLVGFSGFDWTTSGSARTMAKQAAEEAVLKQLVPICVEQAKAASAEDLTALKEEKSWNRKKFVMDRGWATMPGASSPVSTIADECAEAILKT